MKPPRKKKRKTSRPLEKVRLDRLLSDVKSDIQAKLKAE
jgi:hypothetical protein